MQPVHREVFLKLIFPWDVKYTQLYKCVTTIFPNRQKPGDFITVNHVAQSYDDLLRLIDMRANWTRANVYVALGVQRMASAETSNDGFAKAVRKAHNMVSFSSLFMDIDVGKPGCYPTQLDALIAVQQFCMDSGMPEPTMIVSSGSGGLHVYWCTVEPMEVAVWQPLANALKSAALQHHNLLIDPAVTADAARILRVPTTYNYKPNPPVMVDLLHTGRQYTMLELAQPLTKFMSGSTARAAGGGGGTTSAWTQNFTANVDEHNFPKVPIDQIAVNCPMTAATLADGGVNKSEPEWSQDMFLSAWTLDPVDAAHRLSKGHAGYDPVATDKKLAEKMAAIANGQLGWPKCASFNHAACKTCPLFSLGKSPINFAHQAQQTQPMQPAQTQDPLMPPEYWRNVNGHVLTNNSFGAFDVLGYPILDGGIDGTNGDLVLKTVVSGVERWGNVSIGKQTAAGICEALTKGTRNGIVIRGDQRQARSFIMAWVTHLQQIKRIIHPNGFGWTNGSFVFGDEIFTPNGPQRAYRGNTIDEKYQRVGDLKPWTDAMALIYGNPPLEVIVASSFGAPLVELACDYSVVLSLYSHQSGLGKSTALKLAQSVWGHPRTGMSMLEDTQNSVSKKINDLKNLPIYWDEMKTKDQVQRIVQIVFQTTQGRSKARLSRDSTQMDVGMSTTLFAVATNHGIVDYIIRETEGTEAGGLRVFEINAQPLVSSPAAAMSEQLIIPLNSNYGVAGALYADFLVRNRTTAVQVLQIIADELQQTYNFSSKERFWKNTMVVIIGGALLANTLQLTSFDIVAIKNCLDDTLRRMRGSTTAKTYGMTNKTGEEVLHEMMAELRGRHMVHTDIVPVAGAGRPPKVEPFNNDPARLENVWMQVGKNDGRILVVMRQFDKWMSKHGHNPNHMIELIKQDYYVIERKASVGAGIEFLDAVKGRAMCYDMTPKVAPAVSHNPASPFANFGSPSP